VYLVRLIVLQEGKRVDALWNVEFSSLGDDERLSPSSQVARGVVWCLEDVVCGVATEDAGRGWRLDEAQRQREHNPTGQREQQQLLTLLVSENVAFETLRITNFVFTVDNLSFIWTSVKLSTVISFGNFRKFIKKLKYLIKISNDSIEYERISNLIGFHLKRKEHCGIIFLQRFARYSPIIFGIYATWGALVPRRLHI
jgi:hypothetical protein